MAIHHLARQAELDAELAHFVLEQLAQRLDQLHAHVRRQAADVVVRLDDVRLAGLAAGGLDDVRVDRALREPVDARELRAPLRRTPSTNRPPMILRFFSGSFSPRSASRKRCLGIDADDLHAEVLGEDLHDLVAFVEAQQAVIDEHAGELVADRLVQQRRDHRGIHAAGKAQQHLALAHLRAHARDGVFDDVADAPQRLAAADLAHEALEQLLCPAACA